MRRLLPLLVLIPHAAMLVGCGAGAVGASAEPLSVSSYGSACSSASSPSSVSSFAAPSSPDRSSAGVIVQPDVFEVPFAMKFEGQGDAMAMLEAETASLARRVGAATERAVAVRMRTLRFESLSNKKAVGETADRAAIVEGCLEIPAGSEKDFWARSRLMSALTSAAPAHAFVHDGPVRTTFGAVVPRVRDTEKYRSALLEKWLERTQSFVAAAESDPRAKPHLSECTPPLEIHQQALGTDEVALSLALTCKLSANVAAAPAPAAR